MGRQLHCSGSEKNGKLHERNGQIYDVRMHPFNHAQDTHSDTVHAVKRTMVQIIDNGDYH